MATRISLGGQSGQVDLTATAIQLPDNSVTGKSGNWYLGAGCANVGCIYLGASDVDSTNGFALQPGQGITINNPTLGNLYAMADNVGDIIQWLKPCGS